MQLQLEFGPSEKYEMDKIIENSLVHKIEVQVGSETHQVNIKQGDWNYSYFHVGTDDQIPPWKVEKVLVYINVPQYAFENDLILFDPPMRFTKVIQDLPEGKYLCQYFSVENLDMRIEVLKHNQKMSLINGCFGFDLKKYYVVSLRKLVI